MGKSYVVKGVAPPRNWEPNVGDVVYIDGRKTGIKRTYLRDGHIPYAVFTRAINGTVSMSVRNLSMICRLEVPEGTPTDADLRIKAAEERLQKKRLDAEYYQRAGIVG